MEFYKLFDIDFSRKELLCFIGGGGKTSTIFKLAKELKKLDKKVLITTSTAIYYPEKDIYDKIIVDNSIEFIENLENIDCGTITVIGRAVSKENKLLGLSKELIEEIHYKKIFDYILVEADGSKRKTIKAPADHEPVIPQNTDTTIGVIGIDSIGKRINEENVHRPELFCKVTDSKMEEVISEEKIYQLIKNNRGLFKNVPFKSKAYILLNKVDNNEELRKAEKIIRLVKTNGFKVDGIIAANTINKNEFFLKS
ncbi:selenium cofactor biosynthesis protein YqeC [Wukongibacter baidiensis]|uniref:selenium cofactor biosynthesis protein YqeC n=1 Tax=Wukongibacter baidiensis TaxID=1723361 RepID=UPI003D7FF954